MVWLMHSSSHLRQLTSDRVDNPPHGGRDRYQMPALDLLMKLAVDFASSLDDIAEKSLLILEIDQWGF